MSGNFWSYTCWGMRYFWRTFTLAALVILVAVYIVFYCVYSPHTLPHGGTVLGLSYGAIGVAAILLLMYYGRRKRAYRAAHGSLQAWLSSHVYIGLLTLFIIPMHAGFVFGVNVHTLAFLLLVMVVLSGLWGAYLYAAKPKIFGQFGAEVVYPGDVVNWDNIDNRLNRTIRQMQALIKNKTSPVFQEMYDKEIERGQATRHIGWQLMFRPVPAVGNPLVEFQEYLQKIDKEDERLDFNRLAAFAKRKRDLEYQLATQMRLKNILEAWLYIHLPVSIALLVAVAVHIFVVVYY